MKGCPTGRFERNRRSAAALGAEMNRQGSLEVNWPQAKRDRPGPFAFYQTTFETSKSFKSSAACRKTFSTGWRADFRRASV
ncbi:hypothetical protein M5E87_07595 [Flavonifractor plautii]|nr:hypothetical protein M5E87_07595 [Flavonifractor plautii]